MLPLARALLSRVEVIEDDREMAFPIGGFAEVRAVMSSGQPYAGRVDTPRGDPQRPLTWEELAAEFRDCARAVLAAEGIEDAIVAVQGLEKMGDIRELRRLVSRIGSRR